VGQRYSVETQFKDGDEDVPAGVDQVETHAL
jgi:hypothetical protein